ncbi:MAG TPA: tRNA (N6-isopentenyl adenosine(37)-C2)-methylthiotransferase MiaB [Elusimicrobia bacterium]|nr:tRNA (N6-isopentenyl adenosine(37)-C2)-methylthiotransferase MiaB [Elusimicrobiota bacterium]
MKEPHRELSTGSKGRTAGSPTEKALPGETPAGKRVHIITFGCQMNEADSADIASAFRKRGFELAADLGAADAVVVNTCTVRQKAEDKAVSQIGRLRKWKRDKPAGKVFIMGCAAQRLGEKYLKAKFPFIDGVLGAKEIGRLQGMLDKHFKTTETAYPQILKSPLSAYVTVMRGCSLKCSYCVVPSVRGEAVCLEPGAILKEARAKAAAGAREIVLLGQTVNAYRSGKTTFAGLLKEVCAVKEVARVRFMSPHPLFFDKAFFELLKNEPKLSRHMHLPVQSGSDHILKLMKRGYTRAGYLDLLSRMRAAAEDISVSTDFIVGYPGETEEDFSQTLALAREGGFSFAFCFKYSPRSDKPEMKTQISEQLMEARLERLLSAVKENSRDILIKRIGRIEEVLLETETSGRTSTNFTCFTDRAGKPGETLKVAVTGTDKNILNGKVIR